MFKTNKYFKSDIYFPNPLTKDWLKQNISICVYLCVHMYTQKECVGVRKLKTENVHMLCGCCMYEKNYVCV